MNSATNPYSTHASNAAPSLNMDISNQFKVHQKEEMEQKSQKNLPFTSETLKEDLSQMYITLMKVKKAIDLTGQEPKADKQDIEEALKVVDQIGQKITLDLSLCIDKLYL
jgi:hypothetical protein